MKTMKIRIDAYGDRRASRQERCSQGLQAHERGVPDAGSSHAESVYAFCPFHHRIHNRQVSWHGHIAGTLVYFHRTSDMI